MGNRCERNSGAIKAESRNNVTPRCAIRSILVLALVLATPAASAQVFKWTDPSGKTHYGDRPPAEARTEEMKVRIPSLEGPAKVTDWAAVIRSKSPPTGMPQGLTMYSTAWCGVCKRARGYFTAKGIRFTEIDIEKSAEGMRQYESLGVRGVPAIVLGRKVMMGFGEAAFQEMLAN